MLSPALMQLHRRLIAEGVEKKVPHTKEVIIMVIGSIVNAIGFNKQMVIVGWNKKGFVAGAGAGL